MTPNDSIVKMQSNVGRTFLEAFGRTPLTERLADISGETTELLRFVDMKNLREETGDLLASVIQLANECGWSVDQLLNENSEKIAHRLSQYKTLGRKIKVALYGGAFNPPTVGHIKAAQLVLNASKTFDEVWLVPCHSHMHGKYMADPQDRLKMCEIAASVDARIKVFDYEIKHGLAGETYNFSKRLLEEPMSKEKYDFSLVIGMDNANSIDTWVNSEELLRMMRFVVVDRAGVESNPEKDWFYKHPHIYLRSDNAIPEISSTQIRTAILNNDSKILENNNLIDPNVLAYIKEKKLYIPER